jgi:adenylate cyclase
VRIRRLRILGVAMALSTAAALAGIALYLLPVNVASSANRIADFVLLNEAKGWIDDHAAVASAFRFPDRDDENDQLRLVAIDEASLNPPNDPRNPGLGQFPWHRAVYGQLLERLHAAGAKLVTFDIDFVEPSADAADDAAFRAGMKLQRTILGMQLTTSSGGVLGVQRPPQQLASVAAGLGSTTVDNPGGWLTGQPLAVIGYDCSGITLPCTPGVTAMIAAGGRGRFSVYPSLAAETAVIFLHRPLLGTDRWHARFGDRTIPLDGEGVLLLLPFRVHEHLDIGNTGSSGGPSARAGTAIDSASFFQRISFVDVLKLDAASMRTFASGKVVVVGPTAQALGDYFLTPNGRYPGVFANLRFVDQLLRDHFIARVPPWLDLALIVLLPLLVGFAGTQLRPSAGIAIAAAAVGLYSLAAIALYGYTLHWMNLLHVDAAMILAALFVALYRTITEGSDKRVIREMFGKHVSPAVVDQMLAHDDPLKALDLSGKRVKVTIFYSDIRGFTAMSEKMTAEEIYGRLNEYFEEMCKLVFAYGGYVDKFIGDCVMAVFSAPNPLPGDADRAVRSAWDQQQRILAMMTEWAAMDRQVFTVGMGLNTGEVVMGNLGSSDRLNYTVIGDSVNTASRLYNVAKGGQIIISESTYEEVKDAFIVNELTPVFVKGKVLALRNFEVVGLLKPGEVNTSRLLDPANLPTPTVADAH